MGDENEVREAFSKCSSIAQLGQTSISLRDSGYNVLLINRERMRRHKELVSNSNKEYKQINKSVYNIPSEGEETSSINVSVEMLKSPTVVWSSNDRIVF